MYKTSSILIVCLAVLFLASDVQGKQTWEALFKNNQMTWQALDGDKWVGFPLSSQHALVSSYKQFVDNPQQPQSPCIPSRDDEHWTIDWLKMERTSCSSKDVDWKEGQHERVQPIRTIVAHVEWHRHHPDGSSQIMHADAATEIERSYLKFINAGSTSGVSACVDETFEVVFDDRNQKDVPLFPLRKCGAGEQLDGETVERRALWHIQGHDESEKVVTRDTDDWWIRWIWFGFGSIVVLFFFILLGLWLRHMSRRDAEALLLKYGVITEDVQPGMVVMNERPAPATMPAEVAV